MESHTPELATKITDLKAALAALPRARFAHLPTPLDQCRRLGAELGGIDLWVKRDDATGMALGGNKTRQLEYILGFAIQQGHDCIIQGAASQSNHARQLAAAGANWPAMLANALIDGGHTPVNDFRPTDAGLADYLGEATKLYSWIIAPRKAA